MQFFHNKQLGENKKSILYLLEQTENAD